jgi:hypothetical protein
MRRLAGPKCLATLAAVFAAASVTSCGDETLSAAEERNYDHILVELRAVCERAPLSSGEKREASALVSRAVELTSKAPDHSWVVDPEDRDTGDQTTATALIDVSEILNLRKDNQQCSPTLHARAERAVGELGLLR